MVLQLFVIAVYCIEISWPIRLSYVLGAHSMLLIAIPKSASTSLMHTLGLAHNLKYTMHFVWEGALVEGHESYHKQHNFGWELNKDVVEFIDTSEVVTRQRL